LLPPHSRITTNEPSSEIDPISWSEIDPEFLDAVANGLAVAEVTQPDSVQTGANDTNGTGILQRGKPVRERGRTAPAQDMDVDSGHISR
jgi:hypothetical protein